MKITYLNKCLSPTFYKNRRMKLNVLWKGSLKLKCKIHIFGVKFWLFNTVVVGKLLSSATSPSGYGLSATCPYWFHLQRAFNGCTFSQNLGTREHERFEPGSHKYTYKCIRQNSSFEVWRVSFGVSWNFLSLLLLPLFKLFLFFNF